MSDLSVARPEDPQAELFPLQVSIDEALEGAPDRLEDLAPVGCGACMDSRFVFLGIIGDDGEETTEAVPCSRCGKGA